MTTDFQALLKRIANGETTEADVLAVTSLTHPFMGIDFAAGESKTRIFHAGEMFVPLTELEAAEAERDARDMALEEQGELIGELKGLVAVIRQSRKRVVRVACGYKDEFARALGFLNELAAQVHGFLAEAEDHRTRYTHNANSTVSGSYGGEAEAYWRGRRDEAGHFRDRLTKISEAMK